VNYVAEQWGRRWITIDTSRVALALARARIMGARYPFYLLADSKEGQAKEGEVTRTPPKTHATHGNIRQGFVYERVPHITLKSIANNAEIDVIYDQHQAMLEPLREQLNAALKTQWQEWEIPREPDAKWSDARVWLTTFSSTLANALQNKINCLISNQPRLAERLEVADMNAMGQRLLDRLKPKGQAKARLATPAQVREAASAALAEVKAASEGALLTRFNLNFVLGEWTDVVDAWQLQSWDDYRDVKRLGRKTRLNEAQRQALWHVFTGIQSRLAAAGVLTHADMFAKLAHQLATLKHPPFDFVVVDEAQDVSISQLRMLAAMAGVAPDVSGQVRANSLFFAGDLGQRIFQQPFSWKSLGVDMRGRSRTLHINYRTSHQIRQQADRLLGPEVSDLDGNTENRKGTVSVFNGPAPLICSYKDQASEIAAVADWLKGLTAASYAPHEVGVFVRSEAQLDRACAALKAADLPHRVLDEYMETSVGQASACTMHLAKGLEFKAVVVMACDDEVIPLQSRIESVMDESDLQEVYDTERHLLYVACTRARDRLLVSSVSPASEFVDDLG
jgi:superfamily I DNA/RNA helicase